MTPEFLREEASRFRGMADTVEREASKLRLLNMATDYEARAKAADAPTGATEPTEPTGVTGVTGATGATEPAPAEAIKVKPGRKTARELNGAV